MANYDPAQRRETWVFQEMFSENGEPVFRRAGFNIVQYDGDPDKYIEPRPTSDIMDCISPGADECYIFNPVTDGVGLMAGAEYYQAMPWADVMGFGDRQIDPGD